MTQTIVRRAPLEAKVKTACQALLARGEYPSTSAIRREIGGVGSFHGIRMARAGLLARGVFDFKLRQGNFENPRSRGERGSLSGRTAEQRAEAEANRHAIRAEWLLGRPLPLLNPGRYRLCCCRGPLVTFLVCRMGRKCRG